MKTIQGILLTVLILLSHFVLFAQDYTIGVPIIQNYSPKVYKQDPQNWSIGQDKRGIMYFGNSNGLLEYDGNNWRLLTVRNNSSVRSLDINEDNRIFLGASGEFGYFTINGSGSYHYVSLSERLPEINFNAVWRVFCTSHGVYYFAGRTHIYRYINDSLITIIIDPNIQDFRGFKIEDQIHVIDSKYGICQIENDTLKANNVCLSISEKNIYSFLSYGEGKFLIGTRNNGLFD